MNIIHHNKKDKNKGFKGLEIQGFSGSPIKIKMMGAKLLIWLALFLLPIQVLAVSTADIQRAKNKLNQAIAQKKTLQGEVSYIDGQITTIQSNISQSATEISKLNSNISITELKIKQAEAELALAKSQLGDAISASYEDTQLSNIEALARSSSFSEYVSRSEYLEAIQVRIQKTAAEVNAKKANLNSQKESLQSAKKKQEEIKIKQQAQSIEVASQKSAKEYLLQQTKGDEVAYQKLVATLQAQYAAEQARIWGSGKIVNGGYVKKGDIIGYIGNSGFSSGPHLHFEVRNASQKAVNPNSYIGNGYFINPVPGVPISQNYGPSSWTVAYSFHTGIDYADGGRRTPVRASADGQIIQKVTGRPNTYPYSVEYGNYVKIKHTNGMYSLYGHLR